MTINAHAEELQHKFVSHAEKKELVVYSSSYTMDEMDFGELSFQMSNAIRKEVSDDRTLSNKTPVLKLTIANAG
ncbi:hypothetical protein H0H87_002002 [Tephrocybe sp. NHM501043]|nr:hypothetical protein H0H87_002002 [Tephrocybe sp. NHM501043]